MDADRVGLDEPSTCKQQAKEEQKQGVHSVSGPTADAYHQTSGVAASSAQTSSLSLASLIAQRTSDAFSGKNRPDTPARSTGSFFEECLNPLAPMQKVCAGTAPDSFVSFSQYLDWLGPLRANENRCSVCTSIFENSKYHQAIVHSTGSIMSFKAPGFEFEQHDVLYFSRAKDAL